MSIKKLKYAKLNGINFLYFIFCKVNGYFEGIDKNKYLTLVSINEGKKKKKKYEKFGSKIRDLSRSKTKNSDDYGKKYMKIKFNSDNELLLNKTRAIPSMIVVVRAAFKFS